MQNSKQSIQLLVYHFSECMKLLIEHGAEVPAEDTNIDQPGSSSVSTQDNPVLDFLLQINSNVNLLRRE